MGSRSVKVPFQIAQGRGKSESNPEASKPHYLRNIPEIEINRNTIVCLKVYSLTNGFWSLWEEQERERESQCERPALVDSKP